MIQIENSFFDLANSTERNCLVICDRGAMDASAFISRDQWENILARNGLDEVEVRDNRYSQVRPFKGQLISECPFEILDFPKIPPKNLTDFCHRI